MEALAGALNFPNHLTLYTLCGIGIEPATAMLLPWSKKLCQPCDGGASTITWDMDFTAMPQILPGAFPTLKKCFMTRHYLFWPISKHIRQLRKKNMPIRPG